MAASEATLQNAIQTTLQGLTAFSAADIVINDWSVLDQSNQNAPYVIITDADNFDLQLTGPTSQRSYQIPITLVEAWVDWPTTLGNLRDRRQAIVDDIDNGTLATAGGLSGVSLQEARNAGPIVPYYGPYVDPQTRPQALPQFLMQTILLTYSEF